MFKQIIIIAVLLISTSLIAQESEYLIISLKYGAEVPTVEDVFQEGQLAPPPSNRLIAAFESAPPLEIDYLMQLRAYGELKSLIEQKPNWNKSILERSLILAYDQKANMEAVQSILNADPDILSVSFIGDGKLASNSQKPKVRNKQGNGNWHLPAINWSAANNLTPGYGNIGLIDTGSLPERSEFSSFDSNTGAFLGGGLNISKGYSTFYQDRAISELRVIDETRLVLGTGLCDDFDSNPNDGFVMPGVRDIGHGTHVSGLLVARSSQTSGVCEDCFLSATQEAQHQCVYMPVEDEHVVVPVVNLSNYAFSLRYLIESGIQTASMSFVFGITFDLCDQSPQAVQCLVFADAKARNIALVAAAGNDRTPMNFPASDRNVIGVSGIQSDLQFWNEAPTNGQNFPPLDPAAIQNINGCPFNVQPSPSDQECGSNFSWPEETSLGIFVAERYRRVDIAAPARDVMSTLPVGSEYIPEIGDSGCTDDADGVLDGYGPCTGTSMSTPIVAGILQMIRSVNPLLPIGDDDPTSLEGVRDVLLFSGSEFQTTRQHNPWLGYGVPDAQLAIETVLGESNGQLVKNRVTPLMVLNNTSFNDTTYTLFPQMALANALSPSGFYTNPAGITAVAELTQYPVEEADGEPVIVLVPLAPIYVFTTPWNPITQINDLNPLYRMTKEAVSVAGCIPGRDNPSTCFVTDRSTVMSTDEVELETFYSQGFELQGIEGYVIPCSSEQCNTGSASRVYRVYDNATDSYFLTQILPGQNETYEIIGAAFLNFDNDGDGLTVGMEFLLGTSDNDVDSDDDDLSDSFEYPAAGVPFSDPLISDIIFEDGFE